MTEENKQPEQQSTEPEAPQLDPQVEKEARLFGWVPKEEFR